MKTQFTSYQYAVSEEQLSKAFDGNITGVKECKLWDISVLPSGHGHYSVKAKFEVDDQEVIIKRTTSNMQLIDAWKSGMKESYEDGEDGFDDWDEVVDTMLSAIDAEDNIIESLDH